MRVVLVAVVVWLAGGDVVSRLLVAADPAILTATIDPKTRKPVPVFALYDKVVLKSGEVAYVERDWPEKINRPVDLGSLNKDYILLRPYRTANPNVFKPAPERFDIEDIERIDYWEDLALRQVDLLLKNRQWRSAEILLQHVKSLRPDWNRDEFERLECNVQITQAVVLCGPGQTFDRREQGLEILADLLKKYQRAPAVRKAFALVYSNLAEEARQQGNYREAQSLVSHILEQFPTNERASAMRRRFQRDAELKIREAEKFESAGKPGIALDLRFEAFDMAPHVTSIRQSLLESLKEYQILRVAAYEKPGTFEPFNAVTPLERQIVSLIFDRLLEPNETGSSYFENPIVRYYDPAPGGLRHHFELNPVAYADGTLVSPQDVVKTVEHLKNPAAAAHNPDFAKYVTRIQVTGPRKFTVHINNHPRPEALFAFPVAPARYIESLPQRGDPFSREPVGSGPFAVSTPTAAGDVRLVANAKFRDADKQRPYVKEIHFKYIVKRGAGQAIDELEQGAIHMIADPSPAQLVRLQSSPHLFRTRPFRSNSVWILAFNFRHPLFQNIHDADVRKAIFYAISRKSILSSNFGMQGQGSFTHRLVSGPFPPQSNACNQRLPIRTDDKPTAAQIVAQLSRDPAIAALLQQELRLKYASTGDYALEQAMVRIKKDLEQVGFRIHLEPKLPNDYTREVVVNHDFDLAYSEINHTNVLYKVEPLFDISEKQLAPDGPNFMGYHDNVLQQKFVDLRGLRVGDRIWQKQREIHEYMYVNYIIVPLWRLDRYIAYTTRLRGRDDDGRSIELPIDNVNLFRRTEMWYVEPPRL